MQCLYVYTQNKEREVFETVERKYYLMMLYNFEIYFQIRTI